MLDRAFSYTVFTRQFASPRSLVDISELPDAGCRGAPVNSTPLRAFWRAVGFAASAYAEQSGGRTRVLAGGAAADELAAVSMEARRQVTAVARRGDAARACELCERLFPGLLKE